MDLKQWFTEHTSIQGMSGPLELRRQCNHLTEKTAIALSAPVSRRATYTEVRAECSALNKSECADQPGWG